MHLYLKIIQKTYQFIYCFNSSFLAVAAMVAHTFSLIRKIIYSFSLFMALILFYFEHLWMYNLWYNQLKSYCTYFVLQTYPV